MNEIISQQECERRGYFSMLEFRPELLPWFISHTERYARLFSWIPEPIDIAIRMKWILLDQGLAATGHLVAECKKNKGKFHSGIREYRLPTQEEVLGALLRSMNELFPLAAPEQGGKK